MSSALVIRCSALGDVILVEPVIRALRALLGRAHIDLVTDVRFEKLMQEGSGADRVIGWDLRGTERGFLGFTRVRSRLPEPRYDVIVDLQGKLRTRAFARSVAARTKVTLEKRTRLRAMASLFGLDPPMDDRHAVDLYLSVLESLGWTRSEAFDRRPRLSCAPRPRSSTFPRVLGLAPGASHATKRWPSERFASLADRISDGANDATFMLVGGELDQTVLDDVRRASRRARFLDRNVTKMDVLSLAHELAALDLLIAVDTGPAHLAAALGVPVVVLFGPTSPRRWGPIGPMHRVVSRELSCSPCSNIGGDTCRDPRRAHACMNDLDVDRVFLAAMAALGDRR